MLAMVMLAGCGIAAQSIKTQHPGNVHRVNPNMDFQELRESERLQIFGSIYVGIVLTMRAGNQRVIGGHPFIVMPYTEGIWEDYSMLLGWLASYSPSPENVAKRRDAEGYIKESMIVYNNKLSEGNVIHLVRKDQTKVNGETQIDRLPAGEYIIITSYADAFNRAEWLVRFRVKANQTTQVILNNANAYLR
jgi:hypothetical protein